MLPATRSVFGSVEFSSIWEKHHHWKAYLGFWPVDNPRIVYPFFLRPVCELPAFREVGENFFDLGTPDYTGPISIDPQCNGAPKGFEQEFSAWCVNNGVITEFAHLYPWGAPEGLLDQSSVVFNREIVFVDLTMTEEQLWQSSFAHNCRKNIRRSLSEGVTIEIAKSPEDVHEFRRIYHDTMSRNGAFDRYDFPESFFQDIAGTLPDNSLFLLCRLGSRTIGSVLYLYDDENMYSYLGGADIDFQNYRPSNGIHYAAIRWGMDNGKKRLILGGGYQPGDGIFRFKSGFSPLRANFFTYRRVHLRDVHDQLCQMWIQKYGQPQTSEGFAHFPLYRTSV
jgi:hypothetical protein